DMAATDENVDEQTSVELNQFGFLGGIHAICRANGSSHCKIWLAIVLSVGHAYTILLLCLIELECLSGQKVRRGEHFMTRDSESRKEAVMLISLESLVRLGRMFDPKHSSFALSARMHAFIPHLPASQVPSPPHSFTSYARFVTVKH
ncbi:hypothetical protein, partial [Acinetobacter baumannii]|uniref:hypothetical protein n=1 Tax=Acinetobacter baumannii TaxID=470 RepID=UPI003399D59C